MAPEPLTPRPAPTWRGGPPPQLARPDLRGWLRILRRGLPALLILALATPLLVLLRAVERLFPRHNHPLSGPWVQGVCRLVLAVIGLGWARRGQPMAGPGAVVANHSSWLDILVLNAAMPVFFVAKAEVASWPGINILTRATNTHFVTRDARLARAQAAEFTARTAAGDRLLFFPEGTSSDGRRVLPFKATLFQGFLAPDMPTDLAIQPVSVLYHAPEGADPRFYGWWADMALGPHLLAVLATRRPGRAEVRLLPPIPVAGHDRKSLARVTEAAIRHALPELPHPAEPAPLESRAPQV